jgi:predicted nucleotidyltransferase
MLPIEELLKRLLDQGVEFVIIGGVAGLAHGSTRVTADLDICYSRAPESLENLVKALAPVRPQLRGAPPGLPFLWDARTLRAGLNFTLETDLGPIDLLGEVQGIGQYAAAVAASQVIPLFDCPCRVLTLQALIRAKRATGRERDIDHLKELEALKEMQERGPKN